MTKEGRVCLSEMGRQGYGSISLSADCDDLSLLHSWHSCGEETLKRLKGLGDGLQIRVAQGVIIEFEYRRGRG